MMNEKETLLEPTAEDQRLRCPICAAFPRLLLTILDSRSGKTVRLHECRCGEVVWDHGG